jgi:hypothetical protein
MEILINFEDWQTNSESLGTKELIVHVEERVASMGHAAEGELRQTDVSQQQVTSDGLIE